MAMAAPNDIGLATQVGEANLWRLAAPKPNGWARSARPGAADKYFIVSADSHVVEPHDLWATRIDPKYRHRVPRIVVDDKGVQWRHAEGQRPKRLLGPTLQGDDLLRSKAPADPLQRLGDMDRDGIDAEVLFPNKGIGMYATPDPVFAQAQCAVYNDWAWEVFGPYSKRLMPAAAIAGGDIEGAVAEIHRTARMGFRVFNLGVKPVYGDHDPDTPNYNHPQFDRIWAAIQETGCPLTFHIGTGQDPRGARGHGGAIINYAFHGVSTAMEPLAHLCASGVLERFPRLCFGLVEAGIGWIPWYMDAMDEAFLKHHMWVSPKLELKPSEYFRRQGFSTFQEDAIGLALVEPLGYADNFLWANDYPHHEGTWPHSAAAIERTMDGLREQTRAKLLGLNAARVFGFEVAGTSDMQAGVASDAITGDSR